MFDESFVSGGRKYTRQVDNCYKGGQLANTLAPEVKKVVRYPTLMLAQTGHADRLHIHQSLIRRLSICLALVCLL